MTGFDATPLRSLDEPGAIAEGVKKGRRGKKGGIGD
jgi:hypothetical protein